MLVFIPYLILVVEDVYVNIILLRAMAGEGEGLHELAHRLPVVAQLARHLHQNAVPQGLLTVHLDNTILVSSRY